MIQAWGAGFSLRLIAPPLHGQLGAWDELIFYCLPVVITIIVLAIASQRARQKQERTRQRSKPQDDRDSPTR